MDEKENEKDAAVDFCEKINFKLQKLATKNVSESWKIAKFEFLLQ